MQKEKIHRTTKGKIFIVLLAVAVTVTGVLLVCMNILDNSDIVDNEPVSETDVEEGSDLSRYFGGPVENILTNFPDMVSDDFNTLYYNSEISVNVDRNGNILSIPLMMTVLKVCSVSYGAVCFFVVKNDNTIDLLLGVNYT